MKLIVALDNKNGIGKNNKLAWNHSCDLKYFSKLTKGNGNNCIIMGRNTFNSIGKHLPGRANIILSKSLTADNVNIFLDVVIICKTLICSNISLDFSDPYTVTKRSDYLKKFQNLH